MYGFLDQIYAVPTKLLFAVILGAISLMSFVFYLKKPRDFHVSILPEDLKLFLAICFGLFSAGLFLNYFLDR